MWPFSRRSLRAENAALRNRLSTLEAASSSDTEKTDLFVPPLVYTFGGGSDGLPVGRSGRYLGASIALGLRANSAVMACVEWIRRVASSAELIVVGPEGETDTPDVRVGQEALNLLRARVPGIDPNVFLDSLWTDLVTAGNAYWLIQRGSRKRPMALRYLPPSLVFPSGTSRQNAEDYLTDTEPSGWSISVSGTYGGLKLPEEIVRLRWSVDPTYPALGLTPLAAAVRETETDTRAADYAKNVLENFGFAGVVISPEAAPFHHDVAREMKAKWTEHLAGVGRGGVLVSQQPVKVHHPKPEGLSGIDLSAIRNLTEERVCALLGISPAVIGLGTGLEQTKVGATMLESVRLSWRQCLIPLQDMVAHQLTMRLMPEFGVDPKTAMFRFDRTQVQALQESAAERATRLVAASGGPYLSVDEARDEDGREPVEDGDKIRGMGEAPDMTGDDDEDEDEEEVEDEEAEDEEEESGKAIGSRTKSRVPRLRADTTILSPAQRVFIERQKVALWSHTRRAVRDYAADLDEIEMSTRSILGTIFHGPESESALAALRERGKALPEGLSAATTAELVRLAHVGTETVKAQMDALFELLGTTTDAAATEIASTTGSHWTAAIPEDAVVTAALAEITERVHSAWHRDRARLILRGIQKSVDTDQIMRLIIEAGGNPDTAARSIAKHVTRGRWKTTLTRARIMARTESQWLQREAVIQTAERARQKQLEVIDGLLPSSDSECVNLNGARVSLEEARALHAAEHAQGTRDFIPAV